MSVLGRAALIIDTIEYLTIASVTPEGLPWNTPVYTAFDDNLNFYWQSWVENQHSKNIEAHSEVFLVMYDSRAPVGTGEGVYFKARAHPLFPQDEEEIKKACELLSCRAGGVPSDYKSFFDGDPRRVYKAVPHQVWVNDGSSKNGDFIDVRHELDLAGLKQEMSKSK